MSTEKSISVLASLFTNMSHATMLDKISKIPLDKNPIKSIIHSTFIEDDAKNAQVNCYLLTSVSDKKQGVISYQATATEEDWRTNMDWDLTEQTPTGDGTSIQIHSGFLKQAQSVAARIHEWIRTNSGQISSIIFTGFSQGGALAAVGAQLYCNCGARAAQQSTPISIYSQSSPRSGNRGFYAQLERVCLTFENQFVEQDPVPRLPPRNVPLREYGQPVNTQWVSRGNDKITLGYGPGWCATCCAWMRRRNYWNDHDIYILIEKLTGIMRGEV